MNIKSPNSIHFIPDIVKSNNNNITNKDIHYFIKKLNINYVNKQLSPYFYCDNNYSFIRCFFIEIKNKYSIISIFSNNYNTVKELEQDFKISLLITNNKLCDYKKQYTINNNCIKLDCNILETVLIYDYSFKDLFKNILLIIPRQKFKNILIITLPSLECECYLNLLFFILQYYDIEIYKPFITPLYDTRRILICKRNNLTCDNIEYIKMIHKTKYKYFVFNNLGYNLLIYKKIVRNNLCFYSRLLDVFQKYNNNNNYSQNKEYVTTWLLNNNDL
jgi:hypothetical protein